MREGFRKSIFSFVAKNRGTLALFILSCTSLQAIGVELNASNEKFSRELQTDIQSKLNPLNHDSVTFLVTVHVNPLPEKKPEPAQAAKTGVDVGYIPIPLENVATPPEKAEQNPIISFLSLDVVLHVAGEPDNALIESAKDIIRSSTRGLSASIEVKKVKGNYPKKRNLKRRLRHPQNLTGKRCYPCFPFRLRHLS